jgi:PAS domain S-box-containing protein
MPDDSQAVDLPPPSPDIAENDPSETYADLKERLEKQLALLKQQIAQRKEAEEALRRESAIVKLLQEVAAAANQSETSEDAYQFALNRICDHTGWPVGHVYVVCGDGSDEIISGRIWCCDDDVRFGAFRESTESSRFTRGVGWLGKVFSSGKAAWIEDIHREPDFAEARSTGNMELQSGFAFPVMVGTDAVAVLELYSPELVEPDESLLEAMTYIGTQLGRVVERVRAREALQRHQVLLANAERLASLGSWEWDILHNQVTWSEEMHRIYGLSQEEFGGGLKDYLIRVHPDDRDNVFAFLQSARERKIPFRFYHRIVKPDGQVRTLLARGKPVLSETGELQRMFGTGQDVTEQREAETKLTHRAEQLAALSEMGQTVTITRDLETVFEKVLGELLPLLGAAGVYILLLEDKELVFAATNEVRARDLKGKRVLAIAGVAGEVLRTGQAIGLYGREASKRVFYQIVDTAGYRPGALLVAPLRLRGELIGVMEAVHPERAGFNNEDLQLLEAAAAWTAIAIGNARLFESQQEARQAAEKLRDANLKLTRSLELPTVMQTLLDPLTQLIDCDMSSVKLMEGSHLVLSAVRGRQRHVESYNMVTLAANHPLKMIAESGRSLLITDTAAFEGWDERLGRLDEIRSWLGVPLLAADHLIGVYAAGSAQANYLSERHLLLAEALGGQAAIAIQNARLFSQVRSGRERLRYLTWQVVTAQEAERRRVSRELHDEAGQALTALKLNLNLVRTSLPTAQAATRVQLAEAIALVDETMEQVRLLAHDLRPPVLDTFGLNPALEGFCDDFARRTGLTIHYEGVDLPALSDIEQISFYRFLQEALNNAAKHADADEIWVALQVTIDMACLLVKDNGQGFWVKQELAIKQKGGVGLVGMQERFESLGGQVEIRSVPGKGTELVASVPLETSKKKEKT